MTQKKEKKNCNDEYLAYMYRERRRYVGEPQYATSWHNFAMGIISYYVLYHRMSPKELPCFFHLFSKHSIANSTDVIVDSYVRSVIIRSEQLDAFKIIRMEIVAITMIMDAVVT